MPPIQHFRRCPKCGQPLGKCAGTNFIRCPSCEFLLFFNPSVSVAAFITAADWRTLFIRRAKEPARGKLAIPGGFVDFGETAETALRREVLEEVGLEIGGVRYLCSAVNDYEFKDVTYPVLDLYFTARVEAGVARALDDVASIKWLMPGEIALDEIAFPSMRQAVEVWVKSLRHSPESTPTADVQLSG